MMRTSIVLGIGCVSLGIIAAGCMGQPESGGTSAGSAAAGEQVGVAEEALTYRYCYQQSDCAANCLCESHQCEPGGFSPPNPDCGIPPARACSTSATCRTDCACIAGTCQSGGFSPPTPDCNLPPAPITPVSGTWVNPSIPGNYFVITKASGQVVVTLFTYLASGAPTWFQAQLAASAAAYDFTGSLYSAKWVSASGSASLTVRGTLTLAPDTQGSALLSWTLDGVHGHQSIQYQSFGTVTQPNLTGAWYAPTSSGWGEYFDAQGSTMKEFLALYDTTGAPTWLEGTGSASGGGAVVYNSTGKNLCLGCTGTPSVSSTQAGVMTISNVNAARTTASLSLTLYAPLNGWDRTNLALARLTD